MDCNKEEWLEDDSHVEIYHGNDIAAHFGLGGGLGVEEGADTVTFVEGHAPSVRVDISIAPSFSEPSERKSKIGWGGTVHAQELTHSNIVFFNSMLGGQEWFLLYMVSNSFFCVQLESR